MAGGVRTLADGNTKLTILITRPANLDAITLTELQAGIEASCKVAKSGTKFSPSASDTEQDAPLCDEGNSAALGASNYEGTLAPFWYLDKDGKYVLEDNAVYEAARAKGATLTYVFREGPKSAVAWAQDDRYDAYVGVSDNPQKSDGGGYVKRTIPVQVQAAALDKTVAASG
ncbi:phage tail tube protein [Lactobacillus amylovorus]